MTAVATTVSARTTSWAVSPPGALGPDSVVEVAEGGNALIAFRWGRYDAFGTAAYWVAQACDGGYSRAISPAGSLAEEVAFCLLGGYGITAEVNDAAFRSLIGAGLVKTDPLPKAEDIEAVLRTPLAVRGRRQPIRYRFPQQKALRLHMALQRLSGEQLPSPAVELRDALMGFTGIGPKTASWIVRNQTGSNEVAIIDVHLRRAGLASGFFRSEWRLPEDYPLFEAAFLAYAGVGRVGAGVLDVCIWDQVRRLGRAAARFLKPASVLG